MPALHISLICSITFKLWSGACRTFCLIHTWQSTRFTKRRRQSKCYEYIYTIVGMRLDQRSFWDSWKLVGRPWRYRHRIWSNEWKRKTKTVDKCIFIELIIYSNGNWLYAYHSLLIFEALGLSLPSLLVNMALSVHNLRVSPQKLNFTAYSIFRTTLLSVMN